MDCETYALYSHGREPKHAEVLYPSHIDASQFGDDELVLTLTPAQPPSDDEVESSVAAVYPFFEIRMSVADARTLAQSLVKEADDSHFRAITRRYLPQERVQ